MTDEEAALQLAGWAQRCGIEAKFDLRRVRGVEVVFLLLARK